MIRLEDVGPGGEYNSLDGLGKLRAVMNYLEVEHIPFHVAVIPRWKSMLADGSWTERGIDDPEPDSISRGLNEILLEAQQHGGILGMHGYSHQFGNAAMKGDNQNSGTGAEFKVSGFPVTKDPAYAAERMQKSLSAFAKAGLHPAFWESPHYKDTREQERVFRSFMGILYQPDFYSLRSLKDLNVYENINSYGKSSLGSIYVPAPLGYVKDKSSVDKILSKASKSKGLASFYFHPFLEFPYLKKELGGDGKPVMKNGVPVYIYKGNGNRSYLHQLVKGLKEEKYRFMPLYNIVPFTPAHRVKLPVGTKEDQLFFGDVAGEGHADMVVRMKDRILVVPGNYSMPRNRPQKSPQVWLKKAFKPEEKFFLVDFNGDKKQDLLSYNSETGSLAVFKAGEGKFQSPVVIGRLPSGLDSIQTYQSLNGSGLIALLNGRLLHSEFSNGHLTTKKYDAPFSKDHKVFIGEFQNSFQTDILSISPSGRQALIWKFEQGRLVDHRVEGLEVSSDDQVDTADSNGDGRNDLIVYNKKTGVWRVFENEGNDRFRSLDNDFGPWARGNERIGIVADFDGNGKADIGSFDESGHLLDIALSFQEKTP
ncbi:DUF2334 domain-containing protein [Falsibacillus pallidus]|uniref:DUF2334 domain-containing protein n=1 Tax=Falsibacillus pallidus TaxID=493781 RepID=UPI003D998E99